MADERIWTAADLEALTPDERDRIVKEGIVTDLSQVPPTSSLVFEPKVARSSKSAESSPPTVREP